MSLEMRRAQVPPTHGAPPVRFVAVVNKLADEVAKQANRLGPAEVALFRAVVEAAGTSGRSATHGISSLEALKLELRPAAEDGGAGGGGGGATQAGGGGAGPSQPAAKAAVPKLSPGEREAALASLVADGWLCGGAAGGAGAGYGPGPRAFLELGAFLLSKASDDEAQAAWEACM